MAASPAGHLCVYVFVCVARTAVPQMAELRAEEEALTPRSLKTRLLSFFDWIAGNRSRFNHLQSTRQ